MKYPICLVVLCIYCSSISLIAQPSRLLCKETVVNYTLKRNIDTLYYKTKLNIFDVSYTASGKADYSKVEKPGIEHIDIQSADGEINILYDFGNKFNNQYDFLQLLEIEEKGIGPLPLLSKNLWEKSDQLFRLKATKYHHQLYYFNDSTTFKFRVVTYDFYRKNKLLDSKHYLLQYEAPKFFSFKPSFLEDFAFWTGCGIGGWGLIKIIDANGKYRKADRRYNDDYKPELEFNEAVRTFQDIKTVPKKSTNKSKAGSALLGAGVSLASYAIIKHLLRKKEYNNFHCRLSLYFQNNPMDNEIIAPVGVSTQLEYSF